MKSFKYIFLWSAVVGLSGSAGAAGPTGAIFTTTPDGTIVNENVRYKFKKEVYLDGGPGPNAPQTAAGLDNGWYVFQVTDPSGKNLLSMDPSMCRVFEVEDGVIVRLVPPTEFGFSNTYSVGNKTYNCHVQDEPDGVAGMSERHDTNTDADHGPPAIVIQLMPFGDTPNPGGVYKAWAEKYQSYLSKGGNLALVPAAIKGNGAKDCPNFCAERDPGFGPANSDTKTDNFKVERKGPNFESPEITVKKFHDKNANGIFDIEDEWVPEWLVNYTGPGDLSSFLYTQTTILAPIAGNYVFTEEERSGTDQTASYVDGIGTIPFPTNPVSVTVAGTSGEKHEVVFGNVGLGSVTACKVYSADEAPIPGWMMKLHYPDETFELKYTGVDGCVTFNDLYPGDYRIEEIFPNQYWVAVGETFHEFSIESSLNGSQISANSFDYTFENFCTGEADFNTKGFWHNKNGIDVLSDHPEWIAYVNGLDPYDSPNSYFGTGAEPFDGSPNVIAQFPNWTTDGTALAEIANFLVDSNAGGGGGDQEQLAQQLLAFIFNVYNTVGLNGMIYVNSAKGWMNAEDIIDAAINAWANSDSYDWKTALDNLNNNDAVPVSFGQACQFSY